MEHQLPCFVEWSLGLETSLKIIPPQIAVKLKFQVIKSVINSLLMVLICRLMNHNIFMTESVVKEISAPDAWEILQSDPKATLLDVRTSMEHI